MRRVPTTSFHYDFNAAIIALAADILSNSRKLNQARIIIKSLAYRKLKMDSAKGAPAAIS